MENVQLFNINYNDRRKIVLDLVRLIPDSWLYACGTLKAPILEIDSGKFSPTVGYVIEENNFVKTEKYADAGEIAPDDFCSLAKHQKLPRFVRFSKFNHPRMAPETIKKIAPFYIENDYTGCLFFYKKLDDNEQGPAGVFIVSQLSWYGRISSLGKLPRIERISVKEIIEEDGEFPSTYSFIVKTVWDDQHGGKPEDIEGIIAVCKTHNLQEEKNPHL